MDATPRHHPAFPIMLLMIVLPAVFLLLYYKVATISFHSLGLSAAGAMAVLVASLVGSAINIPLTRRRIQLADPAMASLPPMMQWMATRFHYYPPAVTEEVLAINVGGALVPLVFSAYLLTLPSTSIVSAALATVLVAVVAKLLARPMPGVGITLPGFVPPLVAALVSVLLVRVLDPAAMAAPVAYIAGTLGALIGADLLNLPLVLRGGLLAAGPGRLWTDIAKKATPERTHILSIGGAGVFDGVFLAGIIAAFLAH